MKTILKRGGWAIAGALGLAVVLVAARAITAGPLDPPGPVASTLRSLSDMVPSWSRTLPASGGCTSARFSCVMGGGAVLDYETGLVWEKTPANGTPGTWDLAATLCTSLQTGGRFGWRLPTANELLSLKDPSSGDDLPAGNPFSGLGTNPFWTSTTDPLDNSKARWIAFSLFASNEQTASKMLYAFAGAFCVRGGVGFDTPPADDPTAWSRALPANDGFDSCNSSRFTCVMGNAAVLDHETGLVWQRDPSSNTIDNWATAVGSCYQLVAGGRHGWRPATVAELASLLDTSFANPDLSLPTGHPFQNMASTYVWTGSEIPGDSLRAYSVVFRGFGINSPGGVFSPAKASALPVICVRGPDGH